jgi:hypothetical protein
MTSFRALSNPFTGEHIMFTETAETTGGEFARFDWRSSPGGIIADPIHPHQEERFTIISGVARFTVNGKPLVAEDIVLPSLWLLAKIAGKRAHYDRWDSRRDN